MKHEENTMENSVSMTGLDPRLRGDDTRGSASEELSDIQDYKKAMSDETEDIPLAVVDRLLQGENPLKVWREYRHLTQQKVALTAGISVPFLCQIETYKREPSLKVYRKLASVLKVSLDVLVGE